MYFEKIGAEFGLGSVQLRANGLSKLTSRAEPGIPTHGCRLQGRDASTPPEFRFAALPATLSMTLVWVREKRLFSLLKLLRFLQGLDLARGAFEDFADLRDSNCIVRAAGCGL